MWVKLIYTEALLSHSLSEWQHLFMGWVLRQIKVHCAIY